MAIVIKILASQLDHQITRVIKKFWYFNKI